MLKNDKKTKFDKKSEKKTEISFYERATPPTRERAKRADQHVYASARKIKKKQHYDPEIPKKPDPERDPNSKPLALRARGFQTLKLALRARLRGNHQNNTIHVNNPK